MKCKTLMLLCLSFLISGCSWSAIPYDPNHPAATAGIASPTPVAFSVVGPGGSYHVNSHQAFTASGGTGLGYVYSVITGSGTINPATGDYLSGNYPESVTIQVTDSSAATATTTIAEGGTKLWNFGGNLGSSATIENYIFSSSDGVSWIKAAGKTIPVAISDEGAVVFHDQIYLIGGYDGAIDRKDAWVSGDGLNWSAANANALGSVATNGAQDGTSIVFKDFIYYIGGASSNGNSGNTYVVRSADGATWSSVGITQLPSARTHHCAFVLNSVLYIIGGYNAAGTNLSGGYSTSDGINWTARATTGLQTFAESSCTVQNGMVFLIGGLHNGTIFNTVYTSNDGLAWTASYSLSSVAADLNTFLFNGNMFSYSPSDGSGNVFEFNGTAWSTPATGQIGQSYSAGVTF